MSTKVIEKYVFMILLGIILITTFIMIFVATPWGDEINYHYPNSKHFSVERVINPKSEYSSAYTPLPYLFGNMILRVYDSIYSLRFLNYLVFLTLLVYAYLISKKVSKQPLVLTLIIILNPYLLRSAFVYYLFNYGLAFALIGIYIFFWGKGKKKYILAHVFWGLAVFSQQWMIIIPSSILLLEIYKSINKNINTKTVLIIGYNIFVKIIILFPSIYLFYIWSGMTHPNFHAHKLHSTFEHLNATLSNWGFIGIFLPLFYFKMYLVKSKYIPIILVLPVLFLSIPSHSISHGAEQITGLTAQIATQIENIIGIPYNLSTLLFIIIGLGILIMSVIKRKNNFEYFLFVTLLMFLSAFTSSSLLGASHVFISIPFLIYLFRNEIFNKQYLRYLILVQLYPISMFYVFYYGLFVVNGSSF